MPVNDPNSPLPSSAPGRRQFLKQSSLLAGSLAFPGILASQVPGRKSPNSRLNIAIIGVGGRGASAVMEHRDEDIIALCDVDTRQVEKSKKKEESYAEALAEVESRGAKWFSDYREMLTALGDKIDAVVISTPDHMHFPIAMSAINMGKHVYCEKPLTHTVDEARILTEAASKAGVVTQMGNQGHSNEGARLVKEWIEAGVLGPVSEVHSWTDRPRWPQGQPLPDHSEGAPDIPEELEWDLWLGVAEKRPYDPAYLPFQWRGWWDFGCGAFGDMACHIMDAPYWGLQLQDPEWIEAASTPVTEHSAPESSVVTYRFAPRGSFPALTYKWHDGGLRPSLPGMVEAFPEMAAENGTFIVGEEAVLVMDTYAKSVRILPRDTFNRLKPSLPPKTIPRVKGTHRQNWIEAIRSGGKAVSDFEYAGPFTEMALLGNVALRAGRGIAYDGGSMEVTNYPEANQYLRKQYRSGWILS